jgi:hypothetical protein
MVELNYAATASYKLSRTPVNPFTMDVSYTEFLFGLGEHLRSLCLHGGDGEHKLEALG